MDAAVVLLCSFLSFLFDLCCSAEMLKLVTAISVQTWRKHFFGGGPKIFLLTLFITFRIERPRNQSWRERLWVYLREIRLRLLCWSSSGKTWTQWHRSGGGKNRKQCTSHKKFENRNKEAFFPLFTSPKNVQKTPNKFWDDFLGRAVLTTLWTHVCLVIVIVEDPQSPPSRKSPDTRPWLCIPLPTSAHTHPWPKLPLPQTPPNPAHKGNDFERLLTAKTLSISVSWRPNKTFSVLFFVSACVNVTYLPDQYGISLLLIWDDEIMFNETVSGLYQHCSRTQNWLPNDYFFSSPAGRHESVHSSWLEEAIFVRSGFILSLFQLATRLLFVLASLTWRCWMPVFSSTIWIWKTAHSTAVSRCVHIICEFAQHAKCVPWNECARASSVDFDLSLRFSPAYLTKWRIARLVAAGGRCVPLRHWRLRSGVF